MGSQPIFSRHSEEYETDNSLNRLRSSLLSGRIAGIERTAFDQLPAICEDESYENDILCDTLPTDVFRNEIAMDPSAEMEASVAYRGDIDKVLVDERDLQTLCNEWNRLSSSSRHPAQSGDLSLGDVFERGGDGDASERSSDSLLGSDESGVLSPVQSSANAPQWKTSRRDDALRPYRQLLFVSVVCGTLQASFISYVWHCTIGGLNVATALFFVRIVSDILGRSLTSYVTIRRRRRDGVLVALVTLMCLLLASFGYIIGNVLDDQNKCRGFKGHYINAALLVLQVTGLDG